MTDREALQAARDALEAIKRRCVGDAFPNWDLGDRTYASRQYIADDCDAAIAQADAALAAPVEQAQPCDVCNALIQPRNRTHYDEADLAAARARAKIISSRIQVEQAQPVAIIKTWHKGEDQHAELYDWLDQLEFFPDGEHLLYSAPLQDAKDAARYRHLRSNSAEGWNMLGHYTLDALDAAIDAAMQEPKR